MAASASLAYAQQTPLDIPLIYIEKQAEHPPTLSNFESIPDDQGLAGARLAIKDNATTGKFLKHNYSLSEIVKSPSEDVLSDARAALGGGPKIAILNMPKADLLAVADLPEAADDLLFNAGAWDTDLRSGQCRKNVLHTLPSRDMLSDALMQFLVKRQWTDVMLITGNYETDKALGDAFRNSAKKFGVTIAADKPWLTDADIRRNAMQEVPVFTQDAEYDAVIVADEEDQFGTFIQYNTWQPRPVMGSAGLTVSAWSPVMEQWAAIQLQDRFYEFAERRMNSIDYASWLAARTVGEAVTRTKSAEVKAMRDYIFSDKFVQDGFKGSGLSYRTWNGQMRQPIPLASEDALVTLAPLEGFLHQSTELDTLGLDQPESKCAGMQ
jgi:ABC transporter substrate binding protein (PQQ-dependent alcohol dehydrogenase system)